MKTQGRSNGGLAVATLKMARGSLASDVLKVEPTFLDDLSAGSPGWRIPLIFSPSRKRKPQSWF